MCIAVFIGCPRWWPGQLGFEYALWNFRKRTVALIFWSSRFQEPIYLQCNASHCNSNLQEWTRPKTPRSAPVQSQSSQTNGVSSLWGDLTEDTRVQSETNQTEACDEGRIYSETELTASSNLRKADLFIRTRQLTQWFLICEPLKQISAPLVLS